MRLILKNIRDHYDFEYMLTGPKLIGEVVVLENLAYGISHENIRKDVFLNSFISLINRLDKDFKYGTSCQNSLYCIYEQSRQIFENYIEIIIATPYIDRYLKNYRIINDERFYDFVDLLLYKRSYRSPYREASFDYYNGRFYGQRKNTLEIERLKNTIIDKTRSLIYG